MSGRGGGGGGGGMFGKFLLRLDCFFILVFSSDGLPRLRPNTTNVYKFYCLWLFVAV